MARLVKTVEGQKVACKVTTMFADGTSSEKMLSVGYVVAGLRYVENQEVKTVTGRITEINIACSQVSSVITAKPVDYFSKDVVVDTIKIDASGLYTSNIVSFNAREIVEDAGVEDVIKVTTQSVPSVTLQMTYTDGRTVDQDVEIGDVLCDMVIMAGPGRPDITGDYEVAAFKYSVVSGKLVISGMYLVALDTGKGIYAAFSNIIRFTEKPASRVDDPTSLAQLADALAENDEVYAFLETDVTIPKREDGRITTLLVDEGKTLSVDLSGHTIETQAYAFYVNGGNLVIRDTSGEGSIKATLANKAYPAVFVASNGTCTMEGGVIDTTQVELKDDDYNWLYGVVCSGNGVFNMTGGKLITQDAAGISITNGTASGAGAIFNISGNAEITSNDCTAIYLADNKAVNISGKAKINGGVLLRLGDLTVSENATINSTPAGTDVYPLGKLACESGCENHNAAILAMTGCYNSELGNDLNITIKDNAKINAYIDNGIDIATLNTKYDQVVNVDIEHSANVSYVEKLWNIYDHAALAEMAREQGKTLPAETTTTTLTVKVDGSQKYPAA